MFSYSLKQKIYYKRNIPYSKNKGWLEILLLMLIEFAFLLNCQVMNEKLWVQLLVFIGIFSGGVRLKNWAFSSHMSRNYSKWCISWNRTCLTHGFTCNALVYIFPFLVDFNMFCVFYMRILIYVNIGVLLFDLYFIIIICSILWKLEGIIFM